MKRTFLVAICCLAIGGWTFASGQKDSGGASQSNAGGAPGPATFNVYAFNNDDSSRAQIGAMIQMVKSAMPEVTVAVESIDTSDRTYTKMKTYIAANDVPQFYVIFQSYADQLLATGQVADLAEQAVKSGFKADATSFGMSLGTYKGKLIAFPGLAISCGMLYYNKGIFAKYGITPPVTYADFLKDVKTLRANNVTPIAIGGKEKWFYAMLLDEFATRLDNNASVNIASGKAKFTDQAYTNAAAKVQELANAGAFDKDANLMDYSAGESQFTSGQAAMIVNGSWAFSYYVNTLKDNFGYLYFPVDDAATAAASHFHWAGGDISPTGDSMNPKKFKTPAELDRAGKFLYYWAKSSCDYYAGSGNPIVSMKSSAQPQGGFPAPMQQWMKDFAAIQSSPPYINAMVPLKAQPALLDALQSLSTGQYDAAKFCADMQKAVDEAQ